MNSSLRRLRLISESILWRWWSSDQVSSLARCLSNREDDKRVLSLHVDRDAHSLYVAFSSCVIRIPLSRCERHSSCQKWVHADAQVELERWFDWQVFSRPARWTNPCVFVWPPGLVLHQGILTVAGSLRGPVRGSSQVLCEYPLSLHFDWSILDGKWDQTAHLHFCSRQGLDMSRTWNRGTPPTWETVRVRTSTPCAVLHVATFTQTYTR